MRNLLPVSLGSHTVSLIQVKNYEYQGYSIRDDVARGPLRVPRIRGSCFSGEG